MKKIHTLIVLLILQVSNAWAVPHEHCFNAAANRYQVDRDLLIAIAIWESKMNSKATNRSNYDGSVDYGLMQINSIHLPLLEKGGFKANDLYDPCTSIFIGAYVLKTKIKAYGNKWRAVGAYNAASEDKRKKYVGNIKPIYYKLKKQIKGSKS